MLILYIQFAINLMKSGNIYFYSKYIVNFMKLETVNLALSSILLISWKQALLILRSQYIVHFMNSWTINSQ